MIMNAYWEALDFEPPLIDKNSRELWRRWIDTSLDSPQEILEWQSALAVPGGTYRAGPRSVVVLFAEAEG
jgi:glycogen operon protein